MKKIIIGATLATVVLLGLNATIKKNQTESYAVVNVVEKSTRVIIRTSVNEEEESKVINIKSGYLEDEDMVNFKPVMDELARLNSMGYKLVSGSIASVQYGGKGGGERPYHSFIFVKE